MSKTTVIALAGKRIDVRPSPTSPGCVLIQILSADRAVQASVTLDPGACGALEAGIEASARVADGEPVGVGREAVEAGAAAPEIATASATTATATPERRTGLGLSAIVWR